MANIGLASKADTLCKITEKACIDRQTNKTQKTTKEKHNFLLSIFRNNALIYAATKESNIHIQGQSGLNNNH